MRGAPPGQGGIKILAAVWVLWLVAQKTVESPQLQWFWASSSSWTRSLCPLVQRLGVRNAWFDYGYMFCFIQGGFWKNFYDFPRDWVDSDPEVYSRRFSPCSHAEDDVAALVVNSGSGLRSAGFACDAPRAVFPTFAGMTTCTRCSRCFSCSQAALGNLYIISTSPLYFQNFLQSKFFDSRFFGALEHSQL